VELGAQVHRVTVRDDGMKVVHYTQAGAEHDVAAHEIFYALGRVPNVCGMDLDNAGVEHHDITGIPVDDTLRTSNPDIYAVGDVTGRYLLVHVAIQQGEIAGRNAATGARERIDYSLSKTHTVFTDPQVAVVGETERELEAAGIEYIRATYPFNDHGKAVAIGRTKGFVKMMASPRDGRILGAAILGPDALASRTCTRRSSRSSPIPPKSSPSRSAPRPLCQSRNNPCTPRSFSSSRAKAISPRTSPRCATCSRSSRRRPTRRS